MMTSNDILNEYLKSENHKDLSTFLQIDALKLYIEKVSGSLISFYIACQVLENKGSHMVIMQDKERAAYIFNDLQHLCGDKVNPTFFPESYKVAYHPEAVDNANVTMRAEVLSLLNDRQQRKVIVTYPEAIAEKVISREILKKNTLTLERNQNYSIDFVNELLMEYEFVRVDYVYEPGQYSIRGGIVDVFSFSNDYPYRLEFFGDELDSIRSFNPADQLSMAQVKEIEIIPNIQAHFKEEKYISLLDFNPTNTTVWMEDIQRTTQGLKKALEKAQEQYDKLDSPLKHRLPAELYLDPAIFKMQLSKLKLVEFGIQKQWADARVFKLNSNPQPAFNKNFELLQENIDALIKKGYKTYIFSEQQTQLDRLERIFKDIGSSKVNYEAVLNNISEGFIDNDNHLVCYTDHQIFERYNRFRLKEGFSKNKQALTVKELNNLKKGDYVVHIDHGIGSFSGLEKIEVNGKFQEAIRLVYKDNDVLYVSIHSLHRISKYSGKEGSAPKINKLGSQTWQKLKAKTKSKIKELAIDLLKLYAKRKTVKGFAYSPDSYLQTELEASFIFEDTPDQYSATQDIKNDMEKETPMDRLVCGDVGFGKTELAIRAAFKAATDGKQVAILVPTTVLSFQHYKTFKDRLSDFPVKVDYLNRFKTAKKTTETLKKLEKGEVDIIIGTHKLIGKRVKFKDLGLLIIDEEQKFGVGVKDQLKALREEVDTLTLTATPIPRTLQFSLMGARDLSLLNTAPPNRYPVQTELITFNEESIRDAINYEVSRGGQVFFVHNRIQNLSEVAGMIQRLCPDARVVMGHGQMAGDKLENVMLDFMEGNYDVLLSTTIIESGIDIPNANTIIINDANRFGLSDLHQLRGRVGRSNRKAFCYLITPPLHMVNDDARKRLKALLQFSDLGSGMNIAMRDLDIRGAGDLFGGEQSGFISDIGFEMYQKILKEALSEMKEEQYKAHYQEEGHAEEEIEFVNDCIIETDLEILIPSSYVNEIEERIQLYKALDEIETEEELFAFEQNLADRFGTHPPQLIELFDSIRLRWLGKKLGFEKITLKAGKMICNYVSKKDSAYYQSEVFTQMLQFIQGNHKGVKMYERNNSLRLSTINVMHVSDAMKFLKGILSPIN
jgi:transcription-repair coupling factor (superfamily II helicase)